MSLKNLSAKIKIPKHLKKELDNKRISKIYKKFEKNIDIKKDFAVAVSGGPDSLSLAFLAKIYSVKNNLKSKFLIVDHKLRPESTKEAKHVQKILKKIFINSEILTWNGSKPKKNIQSIARMKRFKLLFARCDKLKVRNILLGHQQNDLIENFFIRILRGSGLKGLISFDSETQIENKNLFRPLLFQKKEDLIFLSKKVFGTYIKDPTNDDEKYQRIRVRKLIEQLQINGLDKKKFLKTINNLKLSDKVINFYVQKNLKSNTFFSERDNKLFINNNFFQQP